MRRLLLAAVAIGAGAAPVRGDEALPLQAVKDIKAATVFVTVTSGDAGFAGSGFVIRVDGTTGYIATNHHVVTLPRRLVTSRPVLKVVFQGGTAKERSVPGTVVASDADRDLAIIRIEGVADLPAPVAMRPAPELVETMPVYVFGYPFGEALAVGDRSPAVTVGRTAVSSLRADDAGKVVVVQLDSGLNPGNSGGPIVDARGKLVGVAVATIRNANIGLAIPAGSVAEILDGQVASLIVNSRRVGKDRARIGVLGTLNDPLHRLKSVALRIADADPAQGTPKPRPDGTYAPLAGARTVELKTRGRRAVGDYTIEAAGRAEAAYLLQVVSVFGDGQGATHYGAPVLDRIDFAKAAAPKPGGDPVAQPGDASLLAATRAVDDLTVTELKLSVPSPGHRRAVWTEDARGFFLMTSEFNAKGTLRRVLLDGLREEWRLDVGRSCSALSASAEGLLLTIHEPQDKAAGEVWILDPAHLAIRRKLAVPGVYQTVAAPGGALGFASGEGVFHVLHLKEGELTRLYSDAATDVAIGLNLLAASPDGNYLFAMNDAAQLMRYRIRGEALTLEEVSVPIARNGQAIEISPASDFVALPAGGGNVALPGMKPGKEVFTRYCTSIFKTDNLKIPEFFVSQGAYPRALGFDVKSRFVYASNHDHPLLVFRWGGEKLKEYKLGEKSGPGEVSQFLVHPDGRRLLILTEKKVFLVGLPQD